MKVQIFIQRATRYFSSRVFLGNFSSPWVLVEGEKGKDEFAFRYSAGVDDLEIVSNQYPCDIQFEGDREIIREEIEVPDELIEEIRGLIRAKAGLYKFDDEFVKITNSAKLRLSQSRRKTFMRRSRDEWEKCWLNRTLQWFSRLKWPKLFTLKKSLLA